MSTSNGDSSARFHRLEDESKENAVEIARIDVKLDGLISSVDKMQLSISDYAEKSSNSLAEITNLIKAQDTRIVAVETTSNLLKKTGAFFMAKVIPLILAMVAGAFAKPGVLEFLKLFIGG